MMNASYKNSKIQVESREDNDFDNVDILFSIVGGGKPPLLPLREERLTEGVELVFNAKGTGHAAVNKEKKQRETMLLEKLNRLEKKLERKRSYKRTNKRQKALAMVRELKCQLENSTSGISYQRYLDELKEMKKRMKPKEPNVLNDESSLVSGMSSTSTVNMESKVMKALQTLFDDPDLDLDNLDNLDDAMSDSLNDSGISIDSSTLTNLTVDSSAISSHNENNISAIDIDVCEEQEVDIENKWKNVVIDNESLMGNTTVTTVRVDNRNDKLKEPHNNSFSSMIGADIFENSSKSIMSGNYDLQKSSKSANSVRFKDVKPTTDDNIAQAKALVESARVLQKSFSNENETPLMSKQPLSSFDTPSVKSNSSRSATAIRQKYSVEKPIVNENDRYHLFVSHACPWSHRCLITLALKRLENVIGVSYVDCKWDPQPLWNMGDVIDDVESDISFWSIKVKQQEEDEIFDTFLSHYISDKQPQSVRVPVLWDKKQNAITSDKSSEIMKILNYEFNQFSRRPKLNLFPAGFKRENENLNKWIHEKLHLGIYKCGLARSQEQYDEAVEDVTIALDKANAIVQKRGFLAGQKLTDSDIRLFVILFRFDEVYRILFKVNTRMMVSMPGLLDFLRDIYQVKGIKDVSNMEKIKEEFYAVQGKTYIVPRGSSFISFIAQDETTI
jgi:putative glutathione S-transferase